MTENEIITPEIENQEEPSYADIITEMRNNTVPKDKYERLKTENEKLMRAVANGEKIEVEAPKTPDLKELRKTLYTDEVQNISDLEMITKTLELRQAIIDAGGEDPFVPQGKKFMAEDSDYTTAEKVADVLKQCVEYADGDNAIFINELQRRTADVSPIATKKPRGRR
jgi:hypothetical protein